MPRLQLPTKATAAADSAVPCRASARGLEALGEPVVGGVPAQLAAGTSAGVVSASMTTSSVRVISAKSSSTSTPMALDSTVWCGRAGHQPGLGRGGQRRPRLPDGAGDRQLRQLLVGLDHVDLVDGQPEPVAEVGEADDDAGPGSAVKRSRTGSSRPPMPSGWISSVGCAGRDRRADLEHVGAEDLLLARDQVVGVVLHEGRAARAALPPSPSRRAAASPSSSRPRRRSRSRRPSAAARRARAADAGRRGPRSSW